MILIELIKVIFLGIIQGITEWLPISSTGHMILFDDLIPLKLYSDTLMNQEFVDMFMVVVQLGSILAVLLIYFKKLYPFGQGEKHQKDTLDLWVKVAIAAVPAGILGLLIDDILDTYLYNSIVVAITLIVYGFAFLWVESRDNKTSVRTLQQLDIKTVIGIGLFQMLALIPGTSRSGSTILGAILLGCSRTVAAEFSFFLAIPMMFGASLLKLLKMKVALDFIGVVALLLGMTVAFVVSVIAIKSLMKYIRKHDFKVFGIYRIVLGIIVLVYFLVIK